MEGWVDLGDLIMAWPGVKPTTAWWKVLCPNRCSTQTPHMIQKSQLKVLTERRSRLVALFSEYVTNAFYGCVDAHCSHMATVGVKALEMIGKGFYRKWVKSSFEQIIATQKRVGSTNGWIISKNAEILKFYFSTISGNLRNLWRYHMAKFRSDGLRLVCECIYIVN